MLTFTRAQEGSLSSQAADIGAEVGTALHILTKYGSHYLTRDELSRRVKSHVAVAAEGCVQQGACAPVEPVVSEAPDEKTRSAHGLLHQRAALSLLRPGRASAFSSWRRSLIATRSWSVNPLGFLLVAMTLLGDFCLRLFAGFITFRHKSREWQGSLFGRLLIAFACLAL